MLGGGARAGAGSSTADFAFVRYNVDGSLDSTFDGDGIAIIPVSVGRTDVSTELELQADGKIVASGQVNVGPPSGFDFAAARLMPNGTLDPSFGSGGIATVGVAPAGGFETSWHMTLDSAGRTILAGQAETDEGTLDAALVRLLPNGTVDPTFGSGGIVRTAVESFANFETIALDSLGRIVVAGWATPGDFESIDSMVARYDPNGVLDGTFGVGGVAITSLAPGVAYDAIYSMGIDKNGKIVVNAECDHAETGTDVCVARFKGGD